jgi:cobalt-zinc-cadmium resistance protein CzcA
LISGINAQIAVKVFGEDQQTLLKLADQVRDAMSNVRGVEDLAVEQVGGEQHLEVELNRSELARYGLNVSDVLEASKIASEVTKRLRFLRVKGALRSLFV